MGFLGLYINPIKKRASLFFVLLGLLIVENTYGQTIFDAIRYTQYATGTDAWSSALPGRGVSDFAGPGSFIYNPATVGFAKDSYGDFSFAVIDATSEGQFLGETYSDNNGRPAIGNLHYAYKFPTYKGSLVVGGGYSRTALFDRYINASGFNNTHSITDLFAQDDYYYNAAFNTFAIDTLSNGYSESALRIDGFRGITQNVEVIEQGQLGEWSIYSAIEFQKNFMVGISLSLPTGNYLFKRNFLEIDTDNRYNFDVTDYDVDFIELNDQIDAEIGGGLQGLITRLGFAYKTSILQIGASVELPSTLQINETYKSQILTIFDRANTSEPPQRIENSFSYLIKRPLRYRVGATLKPVTNFALSAAFENAEFSNIEFSEIADRSYEFNLNRSVSDLLQSTSNLHFAASYTVPNSYELRAAYSLLQSPERNFDLTEQEVFSVGAGIDLYEGWQLNFSIIGSRFEDIYSAYDAYITGDPTLYSLRVQEKIWQSQVFVGFNYRF